MGEVVEREDFVGVVGEREGGGVGVVRRIGIFGIIWVVVWGIDIFGIIYTEYTRKL